jgi:hypothetical protein
MNEPSLQTLKRLFAMSGNRCAFPECTLPIVEGSGVVTGIVCHIRARSSGGPRYDPGQNVEDRHGYANLILMCARHSKLIDSDPNSYTVDILGKMKAAHEQKNGSIELSKSDALKVEALLRDYRTVYINAGGHVMLNSPGAVQATNVTIKNTKSSMKFVPAEGSLGSDVVHRNYAKHLIDRYNEFASKQAGRKEFSHAVIYRLIKNKYKADWERMPLACFDDLVMYLHDRIDRTQLGRINRAKGIKNYSTLDEYRRRYAGDADGVGT